MNGSYDTNDLPFRDIPDANAWIRARQVRMLYVNSNVSLAGTLFSAFVLVLLLWTKVSHSGLILWLEAGAVLTLLRLLVHQRFDTNNLDAEQAMTWELVYLSGVFLSGTVWGAVSIWLFPADSVTHQMYLAFVLSGICAGAVTVYSPFPIAFMVFALPALIPYLVQLWLGGSIESRLMAALVAMFVLMLSRSAQHASRNLRDVLELQVKNTELTRALHHQAIHDSLVNLINHGEFQRRLDRLSRRSTDKPTDYSLVFVDLDLFKRINDTGGHAAGDQLLREEAEVLRTHTRAGDTAARVGGDEFALLLRNCTREHAAQIGERIRQDIEALHFEYDGKTYAVAASVGITSGRTGFDTSTSVLKAADRACYAAKEAGRNRVHVLAASDALTNSGRFHLAEMQA